MKKFNVYIDLWKFIPDLGFRSGDGGSLYNFIGNLYNSMAYPQGLGPQRPQQNQGAGQFSTVYHGPARLVQQETITEGEEGALRVSQRSLVAEIDDGGMAGFGRIPPSGQDSLGGSWYAQWRVLFSPTAEIKSSRNLGSSASLGVSQKFTCNDVIQVHVTAEKKIWGDARNNGNNPVQFGCHCHCSPRNVIKSYFKNRKRLETSVKNTENQNQNLSSAQAHPDGVKIERVFDEPSEIPLIEVLVLAKNTVVSKTTLVFSNEFLQVWLLCSAGKILVILFINYIVQERDKKLKKYKRSVQCP